MSFAMRTPKVAGYYFYKGPLLEWKGKDVTLSAANTYTEGDIDCPTSSTINLSMLLHEAEFDWTQLDTPADTDFISCHLAKSSETSIKNLNDSGVITKIIREVRLVTSGLAFDDRPYRKVWTKPQIYGKAKMYMGCLTAGQAGAETVRCRIGYTLAQVSVFRMVDALIDS